jgi:hypothetical protein
MKIAGPASIQSSTPVSRKANSPGSVSKEEKLEKPVEHLVSRFAMARLPHMDRDVSHGTAERRPLPEEAAIARHSTRRQLIVFQIGILAAPCRQRAALVLRDGSPTMAAPPARRRERQLRALGSEF